MIGLTLLLALVAFLMPDRTLALLWTGSPATFRILLPIGWLVLVSGGVIVAWRLSLSAVTALWLSSLAQIRWVVAA